MDIEIVFTGLRPGEKLYEELISNNHDRLPDQIDELIRIADTFDIPAIKTKLREIVLSIHQPPPLNPLPPGEGNVSFSPARGEGLKEPTRPSPARGEGLKEPTRPSPVEGEG